MNRKTSYKAKIVARSYLLMILGILLTSVAVACFAALCVIISKTEDNKTGTFMLIILSTLAMGFGAFIAIKGVVMFKERFVDIDGDTRMTDPNKFKRIDNVSRGILALCGFLILGVSIIIAIICADDKNNLLKLGIVTISLVTPVIAIAFIAFIAMYIAEYASNYYYHYDMESEARAHKLKEESLKNKTCPNCGNPLAEDELICPYCDYKLDK